METGGVKVQEKRVYAEAATDDGFRVLIDRLWPRGLSKEHAAIDLWAKDVAPSAELRKAFHHDGMTWDAFAAAYRDELAANPDAVAQLRADLAGHAVVTFVYSTATEHNHADLLVQALGL